MSKHQGEIVPRERLQLPNVPPLVTDASRNCSLRPRLGASRDSRRNALLRLRNARPVRHQGPGLPARRLLRLRRHQGPALRPHALRQGHRALPGARHQHRPHILRQPGAQPRQVHDHARTRGDIRAPRRQHPAAPPAPQPLRALDHLHARLPRARLWRRAAVLELQQHPGVLRGERGRQRRPQRPVRTRIRQETHHRHQALHRQEQQAGHPRGVLRRRRPPLQGVPRALPRVRGRLRQQHGRRRLLRRQLVPVVRRADARVRGLRRAHRGLRKLHPARLPVRVRLQQGAAAPVPGDRRPLLQRDAAVIQRRTGVRVLARVQPLRARQHKRRRECASPPGFHTVEAEVQ